MIRSSGCPPWRLDQSGQGRRSRRPPPTYTTAKDTIGVPVPFELKFACKVHNPDEVERALHRAFAPHRVNPKREFFKIEPDQAIAILKLLHVEDATEQVAAMPSPIPADEIEAGKEYRRRR